MSGDTQHQEINVECFPGYPFCLKSQRNKLRFSGETRGSEEIDTVVIALGCPQSPCVGVLFIVGASVDKLEQHHQSSDPCVH